MYSPFHFGKLAHHVVLDVGTMLHWFRCAQQQRREDFTRYRHYAVLCLPFHGSEVREVCMLQRDCWSHGGFVHVHLELGHGKDYKVLPGIKG